MCVKSSVGLSCFLAHRSKFHDNAKTIDKNRKQQEKLTLNTEKPLSITSFTYIGNWQEGCIHVTVDIK